MAGKQTRIERTEPTVFPDVNEAAEAYLEAKDKAKDAREFAKGLEESLVEKMRKRKLLEYRDEQRGLTVQLDTKDKVTVKKIKEREE